MTDSKTSKLAFAGFRSSAEFLESVLALELSIAVFDCDGTLWSGDAGADFFYWEIERGIVSREVGEWALARYEEYKSGRVDEEQICGEMVTLNRGVSHEAMRRVAPEFFDEVVQHRIFPELQELTNRLSDQGCELWAVSSTNNWVVEVGAERFGIAPDHVLAACVHIEEGIISDRLVRVPTDELKAVAIREVIRKPMEAVFGNSVHDQAMLEMAKYPFCVNPNPDLEQIARERGWPCIAQYNSVSEIVEENPMSSMMGTVELSADATEVARRPLEAQRCALVVVDIQQKLLPPIFNKDPLVKNSQLLVRLAKILSIPVMVTTQYVKGLGAVVPEIASLLTDVPSIDKLEFSCFGSDQFRSGLKSLPGNRNTVLLCGMETHICVMHTALGALNDGYLVHVASDAVGSRAEWNWKIGLDRMQAAGAVISSTEMMMYELLRCSGTPQFKELLPYLK